MCTNQYILHSEQVVWVLFGFVCNVNHDPRAYKLFWAQFVEMGPTLGIMGWCVNVGTAVFKHTEPVNL